MRKRAYLYDLLSLLLIGASLFFFYSSTQYLVVKDYVAAVMAVGVGVRLVKMGVEMGRLALFARRRTREEVQGK